jgi:hypothetical protein
MNRYIVILGLIALAVLVGAGWYVSRPAEPAGPAPFGPVTTPSANTYTATNGASATTQSKDAVRAAFAAWLAGKNTDNITLQETVVAGLYALQAWTGDNTGGNALLKFDDSKGQWMVLDEGGGLWGVAGLMKFGMTKTTALILLHGVQ